MELVRICLCNNVYTLREINKATWSEVRDVYTLIRRLKRRPVAKHMLSSVFTRTSCVSLILQHILDCVYLDRSQL